MVFSIVHDAPDFHPTHPGGDFFCIVRLEERKEFAVPGLMVVKDSKVADLIVDLDRPVFT